jgi:WD40 repeat protein
MVIEAHSSHVLDLSFTPDGQTLAVRAADGRIRIFDLRQKERSIE